MIPFYDAISNKAVSPYAELLFYYMYYIHVLYFSSSPNNANICHINVLYPRLILHYCINIHEGSKCLIAENQRYFLNYTEYRVATHRRNGTLSYVSNHLYIQFDKYNKSSSVLECVATVDRQPPNSAKTNGFLEN